MWKCVAGSGTRLLQIKRCLLAQLVYLLAIHVSLVALLTSSRKLPKLLSLQIAPAFHHEAALIQFHSRARLCLLMLASFAETAHIWRA